MRCGCDNVVRGRGLTSHSRKNRYEWVIIQETWPVQKVQSKNTLSSSDCTTMLLTALWSSSDECVHGCYTSWSPPPYVIIVSTSRPPDVTHVMNETRPSPFFALFRFRVLHWNKARLQGSPGIIIKLLKIDCFIQQESHLQLTGQKTPSKHTDTQIHFHPVETKRAKQS